MLKGDEELSCISHGGGCGGQQENEFRKNGMITSIIITIIIDDVLGMDRPLAVPLTKDLVVPMERTDCCWNFLATAKAAREVLVDNMLLLLIGSTKKVEGRFSRCNAIDRRLRWRFFCLLLKIATYHRTDEGDCNLDVQHCVRTNRYNSRLQCIFVILKNMIIHDFCNDAQAGKRINNQSILLFGHI